MARPPKPTALKLLQNAQPCRINRQEPKAEAGLGEPPEFLDRIGVEAWNRLRTIVDGMKVSTVADREAAAIYAQNYSLWRRATKAIEQEGLTLETETTVKVNPHITIVHEAQRMMLAIISKFGMTPSARAALVVPDSAEEDPLMAFIVGGKKAASNGNRGG